MAVKFIAAIISPDQKCKNCYGSGFVGRMAPGVGFKKTPCGCNLVMFENDNLEETMSALQDLILQQIGNNAPDDIKEKAQLGSDDA